MLCQGTRVIGLKRLIVSVWLLRKCRVDSELDSI